MFGGWWGIVCGEVVAPYVFETPRPRAKGHAVNTETLNRTLQHRKKKTNETSGNDAAFVVI